MSRTDVELLAIAGRKGTTPEAYERYAYIYRHRATCDLGRTPWAKMAEECERTARLLRARENYREAMAPTWAGVLPSLLVTIESGDADGTARAELVRMARAADKYNEVVK